MGFSFATCEKNMAMRHLRLAYPNHIITEESVKDIMPWIIKDIVRIQDPEFHQPCQVIAGKNWSEDKETRAKIENDFKRFHENLQPKVEQQK